MSGQVQIVSEYWGEDAPDWVLRLAQECELTSQNKVAAVLKLSAPVISSTLRNKYAGTLASVEARVRGVYMSGKLICPALGEVPSHVCQDWRRKSKRFAPTNTQRSRMFRACNNCPLNTEGK